jgi:uncharacterized protein
VRNEESNVPDSFQRQNLYIEMPAEDVEQSAAFYKNVFGWTVRMRGDGAVAFDDTVGEVSGAWCERRSGTDGPGLLIYIMVSSVEQAAQAVIANRGKIIKPPEAAAGHITAVFCDPAGNLLGLYQQLR